MPSTPPPKPPHRAGPVLAGAVLLGLSGTAQASPAAAEEPALALRVGGAWLAGGTPPFWSDARDRAQAEVQAWWRPSDRVGLGATFDAWRADRYDDGTRRAGPGDLRLHTELGLWEGAVAGRLCWEVKLPDADDELELGTDETDVHLGLALQRVQGPARLHLRGGVAVLGDPLAATRQAWLGEGELGALLAVGPLRPTARVHLTLPGAGEPTRATAAMGAEAAHRREGARSALLLGVEGLVGLAPASPDWGARGWVGWSLGRAQPPVAGGGPR